ncbi:TIR-like protein FxsC [Actinoplanes sp. NPDC026670]|uniref:TIR-like protein FxsC n=1 Tax=Actinoplanes sp. NPDC026670 TaxID=3154700 RepID=UPI0033D759F9
MTLGRGPQADARYFYLSYAPTPSPDDRFQGDHWVRRFFDDLNEAINRQPGRLNRRPGFADFTVTSTENRQTQCDHALDEADVFVPLYSREYLDRPESRREREWFRKRMVRAGRPADGANILPVLWTPSPRIAHRLDQDRALVIAPDVEAYAESGMSALCRLKIYETDYQNVLHRMARLITETAGNLPLQAMSETLPPATSLPQPPADIPFRTVLITADWAPPADAPSMNGYGSPGRSWRPFTGQPPIVDDIIVAVERLRMPARIHDFVPDGNLFERCPGIIMIDTRVIDAAGLDVIAEAVSCLRNWVGVVLIADGSAPDHRTHGAGLLDRTAGLFPPAAGLVQVTNYDEWRSGIPGLIYRMRRRYLDEHPAYPPPGRPIRRPRLWDSGSPTREGNDDHPSGPTE